MKLDTQSQCSGTTQRNGMGWEVGEGLRMGDTRAPVADSHQGLAKTTIILKRNYPPIKINIYIFLKERKNQEGGRKVFPPL